MGMLLGSRLFAQFMDLLKLCGAGTLLSACLPQVAAHPSIQQEIRWCQHEANLVEDWHDPVVQATPSRQEKDYTCFLQEKATPALYTA